MTEKELDEAGYKYIPINVFQKYHFLTIPIIRWIDALIFSGCIAFLIMLTPFVIKIKLISIIVIDLSISALCLHGIKNRSVTELFFDVMHDKKQYGKYRLGSVNDTKSNKKFKKVTYDNESLFETMLRQIKEKLKEFDEKYGN